MKIEPALRCVTCYCDYLIFTSCDIFLLLVKKYVLNVFMYFKLPFIISMSYNLLRCYLNYTHYLNQHEHK